MKIIGYTCTYYEAEMVPYVMPYVEAFGYDKFVVYDNESTDNTVELLKQYPFVEVRSYSSNGEFSDEKKCDLQKKSLVECWDMAKLGTKDEELIWMTWTDFDEVLFFNGECKISGIIDGDYVNRGYNCFYKNMVNLYPPKGMEDVSLKHIMEPGQLVHSINGIRAGVWPGGQKPTMIAVNDFSVVRFFGGNHYCLARIRNNSRPAKSYDDCCRMYGFHLKYIDKNVLKNKLICYSEKNREDYAEQLKNIETIYANNISVSFGLRDYFLQDYFSSGLHKNTITFSGLVSA